MKRKLPQQKIREKGKEESVLQRKVTVSKTKVQWTSTSKDEKYPELKIYDEKWRSQRQDYSEHFNLPSKDEDSKIAHDEEWCYRFLPNGNSQVTTKSVYTLNTSKALISFVCFFKVIFKLQTLPTDWMYIINTRMGEKDILRSLMGTFLYTFYNYWCNTS